MDIQLHKDFLPPELGACRVSTYRNHMIHILTNHLLNKTRSTPDIMIGGIVGHASKFLAENSMSLVNFQLSLEMRGISGDHRGHLYSSRLLSASYGNCGGEDSFSGGGSGFLVRAFFRTFNGLSFPGAIRMVAKI